MSFSSCFFFFSSRRRHTRYIGDWSSDVCSSDLRNSFRKYVRYRLWKEANGDSFLVVRSPEAIPSTKYISTSRPSLILIFPRFSQEKIGRASCRERVKISVVGVLV